MIQIVEWILDNFYFVLIIAAFLFSFLSKKKQEEQKRSRQNERIDLEKPMDPLETIERPLETIERPLETVERPIETIDPPLRTTLPPRSVSSEHRELPPLTDWHLSGEQPSSEREEEQQRPLSARPSTHDAVQGMMWAEVFGPPRARKPHQTRNFRSGRSG